MAEPTIDILIPVYNPDPLHLAEALAGLKTQTVQEWHALICDDGSPVDVQKMIATDLADPRISFVRNEKRLGIGGNWNACARQTHAEFIAYLFQDDVWTPTYLQEALRIMLENPTVGFVSLEHGYDTTDLPQASKGYDAVRRFRSENVQAGFHRGSALLQWWVKHELTPNIIGEPSFVVMRREMYAKMGPFLADMPQFLDTEYWTRLLLACDWYFLRGSYGSFRVHPAGASAVNQETGQGLFDRLRCFGLLMNELGGEERAAVVRARRKALRGMIGKFFGRVGSGKKVSAQGSGELRHFCLHHPIDVLRAFIEYLMKGNG